MARTLPVANKVESSDFCVSYQVAQTLADTLLPTTSRNLREGK
ncbi:hypothetical protein [Brumimicrobium sp.]